MGRMGGEVEGSGAARAETADPISACGAKLWVDGKTKSAVAVEGGDSADRSCGSMENMSWAAFATGDGTLGARSVSDPFAVACGVWVGALLAAGVSRFSLMARDTGL